MWSIDSLSPPILLIAFVIAIFLMAGVRRLFHLSRDSDRYRGEERVGYRERVPHSHVRADRAKERLRARTT